MAFSPAPGAGFSVVKKSEVPNGTYHGVCLDTDFEDRDVSVSSQTDYAAAVRALDLSNPKKRVEPYYVKKPNIT